MDREKERERERETKDGEKGDSEVWGPTDTKVERVGERG